MDIQQVLSIIDQRMKVVQLYQPTMARSATSEYQVGHLNGQFAALAKLKEEIEGE
jgi:hypothetical protein